MRPVIIVLLLIVIAGGGWFLYQDSKKSEIEIEFSDQGISIEEN
ncbi:hypothetical protein [Aquisalinus flavus]|uniref:Uncharacterized protein n=1 Tax=Aquisalinus flavus TaxID=1526572 RepID=A0A8J2V5H6_9PROT|nr:hypothetical protein [Aquisalinus flavus]GGD02161.1 hypothetical protein GCM10011342_08980 [Aquisalinus flavus]